MTGKKAKRWISRHPWGCALALTWGGYFLLLFSRMLQMDSSGAIIAGHENVWSDWSLHIALATIFAEKSPADWFAYHPMYADGKLTYPFLTNFISGMLMRIGVSLPMAFIIPSIALAWTLLAGLHRWFTRMLGSAGKSFLAISIFFMCGGMGFVQYGREFWENPSWDALFYAPKEYGRLDSLGWYSSNWLTGLLIPQRASLIGMAMAIWSLTWLSEAIDAMPKKTAEKRAEKKRPPSRRLWEAGILAGLLPIAHMHSFIFVVGTAGLMCLTQWKRWKELLPFFVPATLLSVTLYECFVAGGIESRNFMSIRIGYTANTFREWVGFWSYIWGAALPTSLIGGYLGWRKFSLTTKCFLISTAGYFVLANIVQFQPIQWDNSKLFLWAYLGVAAGAAVCLSAFWEQSFFGPALEKPSSEKRPQGHFGKIFAVGLTLLITLTGGVELLRLQQISRHSFDIMSGNDHALANRVREATGPRDRFLTDTTHNHWVTVRSARPILVGYPAWVLNYGFNYQPTEADIHEMFNGSDRALSLLTKHRIHYVVIGPGEIRNQRANEKFFRDRFPVAFQNSSNRVYDVSSVTGVPK